MRFERPVHEVTLSHGYGIGKYEVAQSEYQSIMGNNPSRFIGSSNPVERVSWHDATKFCEKLTARERTAGRLPTGFEYRLPTEAEWEFAARGGVKSKGYKYSGSDNIDSVAWYSGNSGVKTRKVGRKKPNELGIYDMNGNVWEWCRDWYGQYPNKSMIDPTGPSTGSRRVFRGGDVFFFAGGCHSTFRSFYTMSHIPDLLGFRIVLSNSSL
jgi:formylglycine-generating enzyme required for sulfatase activity